MESEREETGRQASIEGFANEKIVCGLLMKKYGNVSLVDLPLSPYDIILVRRVGSIEDIIRIQVKTASSSVSFIGGSRGGRDRIYKSDVKTYVQSPETSDCITGIHFEGNRPELYFVPTTLVLEIGQKSISINRISPLRENYEMLEHCKDGEWVKAKCREYGIIHGIHERQKVLPFLKELKENVVRNGKE